MSRKPSGDELRISVRPEGGGMAPESPAFVEELPERLVVREDVEDFLFALGKAVLSGDLGPEKAKAAAPFLLKRADLAMDRIQRREEAQQALQNGQPKLPPSPLLLSRSVTVSETVHLPDRTRVPALPPDPRKLRAGDS